MIHHHYHLAIIRFASPGHLPTSLAEFLDAYRHDRRVVESVLDCEYRFGTLSPAERCGGNSWKQEFSTVLSTLPWQEGTRETFEFELDTNSSTAKVVGLDGVGEWVLRHFEPNEKL